jgi:hypothetical protein
MEPEGRIPCLQRGTTCFSFVSQINQVHTLLLAPSFFKWRSLFRVSDQHFFVNGFFSPCTLHTPPISHSSYYKNNFTWSRSYEAYHYITIFSLLLLHTSYVYFSLAHFSQTTAYIVPLRVGSNFTFIKKNRQDGSLIIEFLFFVKSQFKTNAPNVYINQRTQGHIWSWCVVPFRKTRSGC